MIVIELQGDMDSDAIAVEAITPAISWALELIESEGYGHKLHQPGSPGLAEFKRIYGYDPSETSAMSESGAVEFIRYEWLVQPS
jgi:hypothetical protein